MSDGLIRMTLDLEGVVQGVGFRPTMVRLARNAGLGGWVQNRSGTVRMALVGTLVEIDKFLERLPTLLPPNARLDRILKKTQEDFDPASERPDFTIIESAREKAERLMIPADLAVCPRCLAEVFDPSDRRYGYPFTTCTECGPRYTVVNAMPYDRQRTTLSAFPLCPDCRKEYDNPEDRRFHAESLACPVCGPKLSFENARDEKSAGDPLQLARRSLAEGSILAVRGIGGFLLAADAFSVSTLEELRKRKNRPHKPFAVMARNLSILESLCAIPAEAKAALTSPAAPIVILDVLRSGVGGRSLPLSLLTPDSRTLGVMLPTSPLHQLLFEPLDGDPTPAFDLLVMTSGNARSEPICISNDEARTRLSGIADAFLLHDREINLRNDDSLCVPRFGRTQIWRRARGFAPDVLKLHKPLSRCVLGMGAELKNTIALGRASDVVLSPHVGDLETPEAVQGLETVTRAFPEFLKIRPEVVAVDLHPDMHSTRIGKKIAECDYLPLFEVQHHYAHALACMAENGLDEALALVLDGTGFGTDGTIWGAELLYVHPDGFKRLGTFSPVALPGGDAAVERPARQVVARLAAADLPLNDFWRKRLGVAEEETATWSVQIKNRLNAPMTHAAGRLFDAVSAMLGLAPQRITYEGQAAVRLESSAKSCKENFARSDLPFDIKESDDMLSVDWSPAIRRLAEKINESTAEKWALAFHHSFAEAAFQMIRYGIDRTTCRMVALSGGVFMNGILSNLLLKKLSDSGIDARQHFQTPTNDGGIAFGQTVAAGWRN